MADVSNRIRELRRAKGLTQQDLADIAGLSKNTIYNIERGRPATQQTLRLIGDSLGLSVESLTGGATDDAISIGPFGFRDRLRRRLSLSPRAYPVDVDEVWRSATEMVAGFAKAYRDAGPNEDWQKFELAYERLEDFTDPIVESYVRAWQQSELSFLYAVEDDQRVGVASNWPISDEAYEQFRGGKLAFFDFTEDMIQPGSQNILVNSAYEFPNKKKSFFEVTDSLFHLILYQLGAQSLDAWSDSFRIICFTGTPVNERRAISNGFESLGITMPKVPFPLYEFSSTTSDDNPELTFSKRMLRGAAGVFSHSKLKRSALRTAIRAYQRVFNDKANSLNRAG